jgi:23S rRNA maturation mini-RNase III
MISTMQEPLDDEATPEEEVKVEQKATQEDDDEVTQEASDKYKKVDYKKRYDDLKRHYDRKLGEWKSKEETLKAEAQAARPQYKAPKTPEDLATFREEYPDVYDVVETVAHLRAEEQLAELKAKVNSLTEREQQLVRRDAEQQLLAAHPDFSEIKESEDFHEWAAEQPEEIQGWIYRNATNAKLAARAIDLYKKDRGIATATETKPKQTQVKKKAEASAAEAVSVKSKASEPSGKEKIWTTSEISRLSVQQYEAMSNELDAAFREGRIVKG